ncbi:MAG: mechanosensitive ion channel family protein [Christensenellaceae bacterium]
MSTSVETSLSGVAETASATKSIDWSAIGQQVLSWLTNTGIKIVIALIVLFISFKLINYFTRRFERKSQKAIAEKRMDKTISKTLSRVINILLKIVVVTCLIGYLGIDTSGFAALFASLGVCVGLAVNGTLSNLAGGVMLILTRPFKVDDYISAMGYEGTVDDIRICTTRLITPDNKVIYVPNGSLSTSTIVNYSEKELRRVDVVFSVAYSVDFEQAKKIIGEIIDNHELILKDPKPFVRVTNHAESCIEITAKVWTNNKTYWDVKFDLLERVKTQFDANGIEIPFNQLDVHVRND